MPCCLFVAAALAKYGKGQSTDDLGMAVEMFLERNLVPRLPPQAQLVCNDFRTERLYTEEVGGVACDSCSSPLSHASHVTTKVQTCEASTSGRLNFSMAITPLPCSEFNA